MHAYGRVLSRIDPVGFGLCWPYRRAEITIWQPNMQEGRRPPNDYENWKWKWTLVVWNVAVRICTCTGDLVEPQQNRIYEIQKIVAANIEMKPSWNLSPKCSQWMRFQAKLLQYNWTANHIDYFPISNYLYPLTFFSVSVCTLHLFHTQISINSKDLLYIFGFQNWMHVSECVCVKATRRIDSITHQFQCAKWLGFVSTTNTITPLHTIPQRSIYRFIFYLHPVHCNIVENIGK